MSSADEVMARHRVCDYRKGDLRLLRLRQRSEETGCDPFRNLTDFLRAMGWDVAASSREFDEEAGRFFGADRGTTPDLTSVARSPDGGRSWAVFSLGGSTEPGAEKNRAERRAETSRRRRGGRSGPGGLSGRG